MKNFLKILFSLKNGIILILVMSSVILANRTLNPADYDGAILGVEFYWAEHSDKLKNPACKEPTYGWYGWTVDYNQD